MDIKLIEATKTVAYYLWFETGFDDALSHWHCAEDLSSFFESNNLIEFDSFNDIVSQGKNSEEYINLIKNIAFRIYNYTKRSDAIFNWYVAEKIIEFLRNCFRNYSASRN